MIYFRISKPIYFANDGASNLWRKKGVVTSLGAGALGSHCLLSRRWSPWKIPNKNGIQMVPQMMDVGT